MATSPNVTYTIKFNGTDIPLGGQVKASFVEGFNKINVSFTSNVSLKHHLVRVTKAIEDFDLTKGYILYNNTGSISTSGLSYEITIDSAHFKYGDISYRISLYSLNSADDTWDILYLLFTTDGLQLKDGNSNDLYALSKDIIS